MDKEDISTGKPTISTTPITEEPSNLWKYTVDFSVIASIAGLLLSIYVTVSIAQLKEKYKRKGRIPIIKSKLEESSKAISIFLDKAETGTEAYKSTESKKLVQLLRPHIRDAIDHSSGTAKSHARNSLNHIEFFLNKTATVVFAEDKSVLWKIYTNTLELTQHLESIEANDSWSN